MKTIVLLSGGIDSTVLLADWLNLGNECVALTFDYGQTHRREIIAAFAVATHYSAVWHVITLPLGGSALTGEGEIPAAHAESIDATYVPARNLVMIAIAASYAERFEAAAVLFGANSDDVAGYPDCRPKFISAIDQAVSLGTARGISVCAPFAAYTKERIVTRGKELGAPFHLTWSCYRGGDVPCGHCGACAANEAAGL